MRHTASACAEYYMARALELARRGLYTTHPNPRVGCVLVKNGRVIAEGWHERAGEAHAEVQALMRAGKKAKGATAYVTLEPCSHQGRTPPCADALITAGIKSVVIGMQDPNPEVAGRGIAKLQAAGIQVQVGVLQAQAEALNPGFCRRMREQMPWVRCKMAMSLDGRTGMRSGESQWITGPAARAQVQGLRAQSSAIVTGVDTVIYDDCALTVRAPHLLLDAQETALACERQPLRVILDSNLRTPLWAQIFKHPGDIWIMTTCDNAQKRADLEALGAQVHVFKANAMGRLPLAQVLKVLAQSGCNEILLETGATLAGSFIQAGLVDALVVFMAPTLLGQGARPLFALTGIEKMADQRPLVIDNIRAVGHDWRIDAHFATPSQTATHE